MTPDITDEALGGPDDALAATSEDATEAPTVEEFDFDDFLSGVRPTRRRVKLYAKAHLLAEMDELAERAADNDLADEQLAEIEERFHALREEFRASGRWFTVEKRSSDAIRKFRRELAKRAKIDVNKDGDTRDGEDSITLAIHQVAEQVISPEGVTADGIRRLYEANEGEFQKLYTAVTLANSQLAEQARVVAPDFSLRPSTSPETPGS